MITMADQEFRQLASFIHHKTGIHLKAEKRALLSGRLQKIVHDKGMTSFSEYYNFLTLYASGEEVASLVDRITTNHTFFMRETEHFVYFQREVLPEIVRLETGKDMRIWSAGCSSGEEPYTLAMIIDEYFGGLKNGWNTQLLATDISSTVLNTASAGIYEAEEVKGLPERWQQRYFKRDAKGHYSVKDELRSEVLFRRFNLMDAHFPFKRKFHVIFCRNVMIYFDQATRQTLVQKFYELMEPGGYLFIGHSESLDREHTPFSYIKPAVYRKQPRQPC